MKRLPIFLAYHTDTNIAEGPRRSAGAGVRPSQQRPVPVHLSLRQSCSNPRLRGAVRHRGGFQCAFPLLLRLREPHCASRLEGYGRVCCIQTPTRGGRGGAVSPPTGKMGFRGREEGSELSRRRTTRDAQRLSTGRPCPGSNSCGSALCPRPWLYGTPKDGRTPPGEDLVLGYPRRGRIRGPAVTRRSPQQARSAPSCLAGVRARDPLRGRSSAHRAGSGASAGGRPLPGGEKRGGRQREGAAPVPGTVPSEGMQGCRDGRRMLPRGPRDETGAWISARPRVTHKHHHPAVSPCSHVHSAPCRMHCPPVPAGNKGGDDQPPSRKSTPG
ncbi:hypothetical protein NDU88_000423 [Pleurodeles waltl]|uniref:Uncharacterized protein n=1 Tax=Pleurodeles waltl TaxID=8319 RepID=A0AAV7KVL5_PLEWA|nr:hypothetical protein NDU88_000423 [Pleurodeles waltl]